MSSASETAIDIRPFQVEIPEGKLTELRRRIEATRWPSKELVADRSQGVQLATLQELARYWTTEYDWRRCETRLNTLPQFTTEIDGVDIHFIHVKSAHENALPLIMTHGWPGSVIELLETAGPLTDPTAHGAEAEDAFHLVLPSLPGYGFSGEPTEVGWDVGRTARAWAEQAYPNLIYYKQHDRGGHFAAWEQPQLLSEDVRATFRKRISSSCATACRRRAGPPGSSSAIGRRGCSWPRCRRCVATGPASTRGAGSRRG